MAAVFKKCHVCQFEGQSFNQQVEHQRIHEGDSNFLYTCPLPTCLGRYASYEDLRRHISFHNLTKESRVEVTDGQGNFLCAITNCDKVLTSNRALCYHYLDDHLKTNQGNVSCPISKKCKCSRIFSSRKYLASHLSQFHPGWKDDIGVELLSLPVTVGDGPEQGGEEVEDSVPEQGGEEVVVSVPESLDNVHQNTDNESAGEATSDDSSSFMSDEDADFGSCFSLEEIISNIAKFYAMLEGKLIIPGTSVQIVCKRLAFLSEILQERLKSKIRYYLKKEGLPDTTTENVISNVLADDPLYNTHHKNAPGETLSTDHCRKSYYKRRFKYVKSIQRNLLRNPRDKSALLQYVPIGETLKVMLEDPTIQVAVDASFSAVDNRDPEIIRNYTDGTVYLNRNVPKERIDIFIFQDAFRCAKRKSPRFKTLGVYLVLANLKPHQRSKLKAKRLVFLVMEKALQSIDDGVQKAFRKLVDDLKKLERNGIEYKGKLIPFRLQFLIGDNLGKFQFICLQLPSLLSSF